MAETGSPLSVLAGSNSASAITVAPVRTVRLFFASGSSGVTDFTIAVIADSAAFVYLSVAVVVEAVVAVFWGRCNLALTGAPLSIFTDLDSLFTGADISGSGFPAVAGPLFSVSALLLTSGEFVYFSVAVVIYVISAPFNLWCNFALAFGPLSVFADLYTVFTGSDPPGISWS